MIPILSYRRAGRLAVTTLSAALMAAALAGMPACAETSRSGTAWIDSFERAMTARSGRVLTIPANPEKGREGPLHAVFYAPLAAVWLLTDPDGTEVLASGALHRGDVGAGFITITWDAGDLTTLTAPPSVPEAGRIHPLAAFHDRLLSQPLETPLVGLPTGSRFMASGIVETPAIPKSDQNATQGGGASVTLWESLGDHIVITHPDGTRKTIRLHEVGAALKRSGQ